MTAEATTRLKFLYSVVSRVPSKTGEQMHEEAWAEIKELEAMENQPSPWGDWRTVNDETCYWWWCQGPGEEVEPVTVQLRDGAYYSTAGLPDFSVERPISQIGGAWMR